MAMWLLGQRPPRHAGVGRSCWGDGWVLVLFHFMFDRRINDDHLGIVQKETNKMISLLFILTGTGGC